MKVSFSFDKDTRSMLLTPENELESALIMDIEARQAKGTSLKLTRIDNRPQGDTDAPVAGPGDSTFRFDMKVNGV